MVGLREALGMRVNEFNNDSRWNSAYLIGRGEEIWVTVEKRLLLGQQKSIGFFRDLNRYLMYVYVYVLALCR